MERIHRIRDVVIEHSKLRKLVSFTYLQNKLGCTEYEAEHAMSRALQLYPDLRERKIFNAYRYYYQINKAGFPNVEDIDFTKPAKHGMTTALKDLIMTPRKADEGLPPDEARRKFFELPFDKDVQAELNIEQWEQTPGSEIYTFSHPEGSHDDRF